MSVRASVIIPNWNGAHHLETCLDALGDQTVRDFEVVVVDNGSTDASVTLLESRFPWVRVVALAQNGGFSAAVNAGIHATQGEYVVLLNNDTCARSDWLEALLSTMNAWPEASFGASKMLRFDPPHPIDSAGDRFSLISGAGINIGAGEPEDHHSDNAWVFGACAGAAIYRRALFDDIGLFDEEFFLIFEDTDLSLRAQTAGHRCLYIADAIVYHVRGASTDSHRVEVQARAWRNVIWVAGKNLPPGLLFAWASLLGLRLCVQALRSLLRRRPAPSADGSTPGPGLRARLSIYTAALRQALRRLPAKRREVAGTRRTGSLRLLPTLLRQRQAVNDPLSPRS